MTLSEKKYFYDQSDTAVNTVSIKIKPAIDHNQPGMSTYVNFYF